MRGHMTDEQIAAKFGLDVEGVLSIAGVKGGGAWVLRDNRTGRTWHKYTERGCYLMAQLLGLTDYDIEAPA